MSQIFDREAIFIAAGARILAFRESDGADVQQSFAEKFRGAAIFTRGQGSTRVMVAVRPHRLVLKVCGNTPAEHVVGVLTDLRRAGHLASDDFSALIDLTEFTGAIDWDEIKKISDVMPKGTSRTNKNAYLVHDGFLAMIAKITSVLFPQTQCAAFAREREALHWLDWE